MVSETDRNIPKFKGKNTKAVAKLNAMRNELFRLGSSAVSPIGSRQNSHDLPTGTAHRVTPVVAFWAKIDDPDGGTNFQDKTTGAYSWIRMQFDDAGQFRDWKQGGEGRHDGNKAAYDVNESKSVSQGTIVWLTPGYGDEMLFKIDTIATGFWAKIIAKTVVGKCGDTTGTKRGMYDFVEVEFDDNGCQVAKASGRSGKAFDANDSNANIHVSKNKIVWVRSFDDAPVLVSSSSSSTTDTVSIFVFDLTLTDEAPSLRHEV